MTLPTIPWGSAAAFCRLHVSAVARRLILGAFFRRFELSTCSMFRVLKQLGLRSYLGASLYLTAILAIFVSGLVAVLLVRDIPEARWASQFVSLPIGSTIDQVQSRFGPPSGLLQAQADVTKEFKNHSLVLPPRHVALYFHEPKYRLTRVFLLFDEQERLVRVVVVGT